MKKVLLIGLILAILLIAFPQGVMADTATINANILSSITFTASGDVSGWNLELLAPNGPTNTYVTPDSGPDPLLLTVSSNDEWEILISGTNGGYMKPSSGAALIAPFQVGSSAVPFQTITGIATQFRTGADTGSGDWTERDTYRQVISEGDETLEGGYTYAIVLTLTAQPLP